MMTFRASCLPLFAIAALAATAPPPESPAPLHDDAPFCTRVPGSVLALVRVEQDTMIPYAAGGAAPMSASGVRTGPHDSLLATPSTLMPAGRVRLLQLDSATRVTLAARGVTDSQPLAFVRAAPYRADCRTIRWTDTVPFVVRGEVGYVRATLAPTEQWINGAPVLVITDVWNYPYPRRRGLAFDAAPNAVLAPAEAMFSINAVLELPRPSGPLAHARVILDSARRTQAVAWARGNPAPAELEPVRTLLRDAILDADWYVAERKPSRLRGTYRVDFDVSGERSTWFFVTHDRPGYGWRGPGSPQTTADLLVSPHVAGYRLVGYAADSRDSLPTLSPTGPRRIPLVWVATTDRPTAPGNDARGELQGILEFQLAATPERLWNDLELLVPPRSARDSAMAARMNFQLPRNQQQPRIPLTVRLDARGGVRADTSLMKGDRLFRVVLERIDTPTVSRPF
jgi:hypothetical protein